MTDDAVLYGARRGRYAHSAAVMGYLGHKAVRLSLAQLKVALTGPKVQNYTLRQIIRSVRLLHWDYPS